MSLGGSVWVGVDMEPVGSSLGVLLTTTTGRR